MTDGAEARRRLGVYLERERLRAGLTQAEVAEQIGVRSIKSIYAAETGRWTGDDPPRTVKRLADRWNWVADGVYRVLAGGEVAYSTGAPAPQPMSRAVKAEWRRQVAASAMSAAAKRENLALIDSIPDAD